MSEATHEPEFESLPALYQRWATTLLSSGIPREAIASCLDCAMCESCEPGSYRDPAFFNPDTKCCTYFPDLPNYLVGRAIHADTPGSAALYAFVEAPAKGAARVSLTGVIAMPGTATPRNAENFGHAPDLLCPYAIEADTREGPLCGIWQHRNAVCSTYFCKHVRGAVGHRFWQTFRNLLLEIEEALSWWAIAELIPDAAGKVLDSEAEHESQIQLRLKPDAWRHWPGTRSAFYEACADRVEALRWDEVLTIAGIKAKLHSTEVIARHGELLSPAIPARLQVGEYKVISATPRHTTIESTTHREHIAAPAALLPLLCYFDGRSVDEVLEEIEAETRIEVDRGLVRRLYDFGILIPVEA